MADCRMEQREGGWFCRDCGAGPYRVSVRRMCPRWTGLGDAVAWALRKLGVKKKCGGCAKRQAALNRAVPFGKG